MTARRSLTVLPCQLTLNAPIPIGWIRQRDVTHLITVRFTPCLTNFRSSGVSSGITQLPVRPFNVPGKAGQADVGLVLEHPGVELGGPAERSKTPGFFCDVEGQLLLAQQAFQTLVFLLEGFDPMIDMVAKEAGKPHTGAVLPKRRARPASRNCVRHL